MIFNNPSRYQDMNYEFDYDFIRDYQQPKKWVKVANALSGIGLLIYGITQIFEYLKHEGVLYLSFGIISTIGGLGFLFFAWNGNKPLTKARQYYLKIADQKINFKLGKYASNKEIQFDKISRIDIREEEIILRLKNGKEEWVDMSKIQNKNKKEHLFEIMKNLNSNK